MRAYKGCMDSIKVVSYESIGITKSQYKIMYKIQEALNINSPNLFLNRIDELRSELLETTTDSEEEIYSSLMMLSMAEKSVMWFQNQKNSGNIGEKSKCFALYGIDIIIGPCGEIYG